MQTINSIIYCPICWDNTTNNTKLPCNHTFCTLCINRIKYNDIIICPLCRKKINLVSDKNNSTWNLINILINFFGLLYMFIIIACLIYKPNKWFILVITLCYAFAIYKIFTNIPSTVLAFFFLSMFTKPYYLLPYVGLLCYLILF